MSTQFNGKVIALTGAASGIGLATAHLLASRGAHLSIADINEEALEKAKNDLKAQNPSAEIIAFPLDVRKYDQVEVWISDTVKRFGKLDGAANLAGVIPKSIGLRTLAEQDAGEWDFVMGVNATGVMHCLKAQLNTVVDGGAIVNASSIAGQTGRPKNGAYTASKHAVTGLTRTAAKEIGYRGVRVNAVCPGRIDTPMSNYAQVVQNTDTAQGANYHKEPTLVALGRTGKPEEVAMLVAFLLSDESTFISGANIPIDGGWNC